jgi:hypothetical protein
MSRTASSMHLVTTNREPLPMWDFDQAVGSMYLREISSAASLCRIADSLDLKPCPADQPSSYRVFLGPQYLTVDSLLADIWMMGQGKHVDEQGQSRYICT